MNVQKAIVNNHYLRKMQGWEMLIKSKQKEDPKHWYNLMMREKLETGRDYHQYIPLKMIELEQLLKAYKPDVVVELGCGLSTAVINDHHPEYHIVIEESQKWIDRVKENYIKHSDSNSIKFFKSDVNVNHKNLLVEYAIDWGEVLKDVVESDRILVYVDAPANTFNGQQYICKDFENINEIIKPDYYIFDMRAPSVMQFYFTEYLNYYHFESTWLNPSNSDHHDVFERL